QQSLTLIPLPPSGDGRNAPRRHALVAPIRLGQRPIGTLQLHDVSPDRPLTGDEETIVRAIIEQVAQIAETLRLFEETQERASRERLISDIGDRMRRAPDMESLMQVTLSELNRVLGTARAFIRLEPPAAQGDNGKTNGGAPQTDSTAPSSVPHTDSTG
ncbi:MAG: GAF domain-containing protein, partial [Caldilineae bacterium]